MLVTVGQVLDKINKLREERSGLSQGIRFFSSDKYSRIRKILEVEKMKVEDEIDELESRVRVVDTNIKI